MKGIFLIAVLATTAQAGFVPIGAQQFNDSLFRIFDNADPMKKLAFELSGITTNENVIYAGENVIYAGEQVQYGVGEGEVELSISHDCTIDQDLSTTADVVHNSLVTGGDIGISGDTDLLQLAANALTVNGSVTSTGVVSGQSLITQGNIGLTADTDLLQLAANALTVNGSVNGLGIDTSAQQVHFTLPTAGHFIFIDTFPVGWHITDKAIGGISLGVSGTSSLNQNLLTTSDVVHNSITTGGLTLDLTQDYVFGDRSSALTIQGQTSTYGADIELFSKDGDGDENIMLGWFVTGLPTDVDPYERLRIGYERNLEAYIIESSSYTTGAAVANHPIIFDVNASNQLVLIDGGNIGINEVAPQDKLEVNGTVLVKDKLKFTQDDGNEYIDSLASGYMDYGATTAHRFNNDVVVAGAISSATMTITADANDTNVSGINTLFVDTTSGDVTLNGLIGGVDGQKLSIVKIVATNDLILQHESADAPADPFFMHQVGHETIDAGGVELVYNGTTEKWYDTSHAKHV